MSFSGQLFDGMFDPAHLVKKTTCIFVLTGCNNERLREGSSAGT